MTKREKIAMAIAGAACVVASVSNPLLYSDGCVAAKLAVSVVLLGGLGAALITIACRINLYPSPKVG